MLEQALKFHKQEKSLRYISSVLGVSVETIRLILLQSSDYDPTRGRTERNQAIILDYTTRYDLKVNDIATKHGVSDNTVYAVCRNHERAKRPIGCDRCKSNHYARGMCKACYMRFLRNTREKRKNRVMARSKEND